MNGIRIKPSKGVGDEVGLRSGLGLKPQFWKMDRLTNLPPTDGFGSAMIGQQDSRLPLRKDFICGIIHMFLHVAQ